MHIPNHLPQLESLLNSYTHAAYDKTLSSKHDIQAISCRLTRFTKNSVFMDTAFYMLGHCQCNGDRAILLTSLIKDKFKYDFESIPIDRLKDYYNELCQFASKIFATRMETVQKQICQSLAYLFINFTSLEPVTIDHFLQPFDKGDDGHLYNCYFQVLTEIAMELDNSKLVLDDYSRENVKKQIIERQASILSLLNQVADRFWQDQNINKCQLIYCFTAWVAINQSSAVLNSLLEHALMPKLFSLLYELYDGPECALDCLERIIQLTERGEEYAPIIGYLGYNIVNLLPFIEELLAKHEEHEAEAFIDLVLCFSKRAVQYFANFQPESLGFINKIAAFTRKSVGIFENYCDFWGIYLEEIDRKVNVGETRASIGVDVEDMIENINRALCSQCRYTESLVDCFDTQSQSRVIKEHDEAQDIHKRRKKAKDLFGILAKISTYQQYVNRTCNKIRELQQSSNSFWPDLEVLLFSLGYPLKDLNFINEDINMLVNTYIELNNCPQFKTPILIKKAFLKLFRSLMSNKAKNVIMIKKLFYYNSISFDNELLAEEADRTFCKGCEHNAETMIQEVDDFVGLMQHYPGRQNIASGVIYIICSKPETIKSHLLPALVFLREAVEIQERKSTKRKECMYALIAALKVLKDNNFIQRNKAVVKQFMRQSLPFFLQELTSAECPNEDQNSEIERAVKAIKYLMRCLKFEFWDFVQTIFHHVLQAFKTYPVSSYVYLLEVAVSVFSNRPSYEEQQETLVGIYSKFCQQSFLHLCNNQNSVRLSFLLDDFLGLNKRFFMNNPSIVINSNQLAPLIDHSLEYIGCDTPRVAKAAYIFFEVLFMAYWRPYFIDEYNKNQDHDPLCFNCNDHEVYNGLKMELQDKVHYILAKMLKHLSEIPSEVIRDCIIDTLMAEIKAFPEWNCEIWEKLILPLPNDIFRGTEKSEFMKAIQLTKEQSDKSADEAIKSLQSLLWLMYKRMASASKRKIIELK